MCSFCSFSPMNLASFSRLSLSLTSPCTGTSIPPNDFSSALQLSAAFSTTSARRPEMSEGRRGIVRRPLADELGRWDTHRLWLRLRQAHGRTSAQCRYLCEASIGLQSEHLLKHSCPSETPTSAGDQRDCAAQVEELACVQSACCRHFCEGFE